MTNTQKKLLAIDGGGIRGIMAIRVLTRIESILRSQSGRPDLRLCDYFDYIGGTSTGGIIAAGLSIGMSVAELEHFYRSESARLFALTRNPLKRMLYARYDSSPLKATLQSVFGADTTLGSDRIKTLLMLVMLNAGTTSPWPVSNNPHGKYNLREGGSHSNLDLPLWQLVRASAAAPYFFEPESIQVGAKHFLFYDGALTTLNNPAFKLFQMATLPAYRLEWATGADRMLLVSIGTGLQTKEVSRMRLVDKQVGTTMITALQSMMSAGTVEVDMQCRSFGRVLAGDAIDSEVGDMIGMTPAGNQPLFTYLRYNALLTRHGLEQLGLGALASQSSFRIDDLNCIDPCTQVGDAIAETRVNAAHFANFPVSAAH